MRLLGVLALCAAASAGGCSHGGCGLALDFRIELTSAGVTGQNPLAPGESRSQDVLLSSSDIDSVDVANAAVASGHVDAFLVEPGCNQLFTQPYNGAGTAAPACRVYVGPVAAATVSTRQQVPHATYRLIVQAWATNDTPVAFDADVAIYSTSCRLQGAVGPTL